MDETEKYDNLVKCEILDFVSYMAKKGITLKDENGLIEFPEGNIQEYIDDFLSMGCG